MIGFAPHRWLTKVSCWIQTPSENLGAGAHLILIQHKLSHTALMEENMIAKKRTLLLALTLGLALVMLLGLTGMTFASTAKTDTVCVDGYIINHREQPVNATKFTPVLQVEAVAVDSAGKSLFAEVDKDGYFKFKELPVGTYNFKLRLPEDWDGLVPLADRSGVAETGNTKLEKKDDCYRIVFKIRRLFDQVVLKWEELQNGTVPPGTVQPGKDWEIVAMPVDDPYVKPQTEKTDVGGYAQFTLTPGKWMIYEEIKPDWKPVTPPQVTIDLDQYAPPGAINSVVFKNLQAPCNPKIIVEKIGFGKDAKGAEVQLGPLAGWIVTLAPADHSRPPMTKVTDGSGFATFEHLIPGVYKIEEQVEPGWAAVDDVDSQTQILRDCETKDVVFKNRELVGDLKIYGHKYFEAWEFPYQGRMVGLSGWVITATLMGTITNTTTTTDALGAYVFTAAALKDAGIGFPGAGIKVCEEKRDNWDHATAPCVLVKFPYPVPADYTGAKVDFVNVEEKLHPPMKDKDHPDGPAPDDGCGIKHTVAAG